jgi:RND family efflux transporter MFP subunit
MRSTTIYLHSFQVPVAALLICSSILSAEEASYQDAAERIVGITVSSAESLMFYPTRNAPAKTESLNISKIPAQTSAVVNRIEVKVGDNVKSGDLLAELDCREAKFNLDSQTAQQELLQSKSSFEDRQLKRGLRLIKNKNIGEAEFDTLKTNSQVARAQLAAQSAATNNAQLRFQRCKIIAPFNGFVIRRIASVGEMIDEGKPVIEIVQSDNLEVSGQVSLTDSTSFEKADSFYFESSGKQYPLSNRILLPVVENGSRSREARLNFIQGAALTGVTGRLFWVSATAHLPAHLLQERDGSYGVFVVENNRVKFINIPESQEGRPVPLRDETQWTDRLLVIDGRHGLIHNQQVAVEEPKIGVNN